MPNVGDLVQGAEELDESFFRLIPSRFPTVDVYRRIATQSRWPILNEIELLTNTRQKERTAILGSEVVDGAPPRLQNWNHAPYVYVDPDGSHLVSGSYGVMELGTTKAVALAMAVARRELFLNGTAQPPHALEMRLLRHPLKGRFARLGNLSGLAQDERWAFGESLYQDWDGAIFDCPFATEGRTIAVFNSDCLGTSIQGDHFRFWWDGNRIGNIYNFNEKSKDNKGYDPYDSIMALRDRAA
jgi:hypothetical protein